MNYEISPAQIRKIKTMSGKVFGRDDAAYREMLRGQAGVLSCKELKGPKIQRVIRHLERCLGGVSSEQGAGSSRSTGAGTPTENRKPKTENRPLRATEAQLAEIRRLWGRVSRVALEWGRESRQAHEALSKFLWRRFRAAAPEWLTLAQAQGVIEGLKAMAGRPGKAAAAR